MQPTYDSRPDTEAHILRVRELIYQNCANLTNRAQAHDLSKLQSPEKEVFDEMTPKLKNSTYGSEEYKGFLKDMKVGLNHHYAHNSHHPEHYPDGIDGMSLLDILEMLCDWKAATERHADGDLLKSIEINVPRFDISTQLQNILVNTANELGFFKAG